MNGDKCELMYNFSETLDIDYAREREKETASHLNEH